MTRQATSGEMIDDLTVASCTSTLFRKSLKKALPNFKQRIFSDARPELGLFYPQEQYEGNKFRYTTMYS